MGLSEIMQGRRGGLVLLHPTSLPDPEGQAYGIGELGDQAFRFVDFLSASSVAAWQTLPLGHTGFKDSPYQTFSRFAGSPHLISVERLFEAGDLTRKDHDAYVESVRSACPSADRADYGWLFENKLGESWDDAHAVLRRAFKRLMRRDAGHPRRRAFEEFCERNASWLDAYGDFMGIKESRGHRPWSEWPDALRDARAWREGRESVLARESELGETIAFYRYMQFAFFEQWGALKAYAREKGRLLIGDIPWYVGHDSADAWARREIFEFDEQGAPLRVAGVPPDYFSESGQLWGNPLYAWDRPETFEWWGDSIAFLLEQVDILRIDHFRAVDSYWTVDRAWAEEEGDARKGEWAKGPGAPLLDAIRARLEERGRIASGDALPLIAEDLGGLDPLYESPEAYPDHTDEGLRFRLDQGFRKSLEKREKTLGPGLDAETGEYSTRRGVDALLGEYRLPWMGVLHFAYDGAENYRFDRMPEESVLYTGTHDNDTSVGWFEEFLARDASGEEAGRLSRAILDDLDMDSDGFRRSPFYRSLGPREISWDLLEVAMKSRALLAGAALQDYLGLDGEARMNLPGDAEGLWWSWRFRREWLEDDRLARRLRELMELYDRRW